LSFLDDIARARALLAANGRVSLRAIQREFDFDDEALEAFVEELVDVRQVADREGSVLVARSSHAVGSPLTGGSAAAPATSEHGRPRRGQSPQARIESAGERRQLTVLSCDLVDSTRISALLDPEDWRDIVQRYRNSAAAIVEGFGGRIAQYLGDGILVYFGHPRAHEDDAERAVRAGLEIVRGMPSLNTELPQPAQPADRQDKRAFDI
jgi:class 3 adenylate cyclase